MLKECMSIRNDIVVNVLKWEINICVYKYISLV